MSYAVVIPSARPSNLVACVRSILANEPDLPPDRIIVVDDGARAEAEPLLPPIRWISGVTPFIYARNANLGIRAADDDVILLNDDARLETPGGFTALAETTRRHERLAICSAGIRGWVGNARQFAQQPAGTESPPGSAAILAAPGERAGSPRSQGMAPAPRIEPVTLAFVCVCIPKAVYTALGELDERFIGYGYEDNDYCSRALLAGLEIATWDGCVVEHGVLPPTFRSREGWRTLSQQNQVLYAQKWRALASEPAARDARPYHLVYTAANHLEQTRETFGWLWRNTNWTLARGLTIHTPDPTSESAAWLAAEAERVPVPTEIVRGEDALTPSRSLVRIPATTMVAAGWLRRLHTPQDNRPELIFPSFQIDRVPYEPWATLADQDVVQGRQPLRPRYAPDDTIWHGHWPQLTPASAPARPRFLGAMRIKNEARWLHEVLTRALDLCSEIYVLDDHSTDDTPLICQSFKDRVNLFPSPFQGLDEARDKNYLLEKVTAARPDWVLWIDGDEVLERNGAELLRQAVADGAGDVAAFRLRIAYLWDDCRQVRVDGLWGRFMRPSFFRLQGQPLEQIRFPTSYAAGNFHCGNVPGGLVGEVRPIDVRLKHYGYLTRRQRQAKYDWYTRIDPNNQREDEYRHLIDVPGARHAPGPAVFVSWDE